MVQQLQLLIGIVLVSVAASMLVGLLCLAVNKQKIKGWSDFLAYQIVYILNGLCSIAIFIFVDFNPHTAIIISFGTSFLVAFMKVKYIIEVAESIIFKSNKKD